MNIKNYQDPTKILSYNEARIITKKEYDILKNIAKTERKKIEQERCMENTDIFFNNLIIKDYITIHEYDMLTPLKKEVMLANALLPDDYKVIDTLTEIGFTLEHLKTIIKFRSIIKNKLLYQQEIEPELNEDIKTYKKIITIIIKTFNDKFNVNNSTIILNRICELLVTKPDLFNTLKTPVKTRIK